VIWTTPARTDLVEAVAFAAARSREAAERLVDAAERASASLAVHSERGRVVPELGGTGAPELFVGRYRLIYVVVEGEVRIRSFIHGSRDWRP
jgi:plasmid stabilization system protein ParE